MKNSNFKLFAAVILIIAAFPSCREGIIDPQNSVGNLNEPVIYKSANAYTFQIDAKDVTFTKIDETFLDITQTDLELNVRDYSGGTVYIKVIGDNLATLYDDQINNDINGKQATIVNHIADKLQVEFYNFSGKVKIQLTKTPRTY